MTADPTSLDRLHDIVAPAPAPWWPPAPGWYWIVSFCAIALVFALVTLLLRHQRNAYRREALAELDRPLLTNENSFAALAVLLKRVALSAYPRAQVASLTGDAWFAFLDRTAPEKNFGNGEGPKIEAAAYDPRFAGSLDPKQIGHARLAVRRWIKNHATR